MQINSINNYSYKPNFQSNLTQFSKKLDCILERNCTTVPVDDLLDLTQSLKETKNKINKKKDYILGKGYKGIVLRIDSKYALKISEFFNKGFKLPFFSENISKHLKCYYGEPIATFGDYKVIRNLGKHTPVGIPLLKSDNSLRTECDRYYDEEFLPLFAKLPQKAFDNIAKDCKILNTLKDENTGLKYSFDYTNPNNFVIKNNKIFVVDELVCSRDQTNTTADLLKALLNYKELGHQTSSDEKTLPLYREIYKKIIVASLKANLPLGLIKNEHAWKHCTNTLCKSTKSHNEVIRNLIDIKHKNQNKISIEKEINSYLDSIFRKTN